MSIISKDILKAAALLKAEELVAIPTETVYGLAGNIYSEKAIISIFETKKRPFFNPLIVHIPSVAYLSKIVEYIPEKAKLLADAFWPGPITLVLKKKNTIPDLITAGKDTVAVRIPNHPLTLELLNQLNFPLAAPSANPFSCISPTSAQHVEDYFKNDIKLILDGGPCQKGIESTIIGFENDQPIVYRLGSTALEDIENAIGKVQLKNTIAKPNNTHINSAPLAPGMLERHYAPITKVVLTQDVKKTMKDYEGKRIGLLVFSSLIPKHVAAQIILSEQKHFEEAASKLYNALHELDHKNLDVIIAERLPDIGLGKSVNDRLQRATK